jgi:hypothetical protein
MHASVEILLAIQKLTLGSHGVLPQPLGPPRQAVVMDNEHVLMQMVSDLVYWDHKGFSIVITAL